MGVSRKKFVPELITPFDLKAMVDFDTLSVLIDFYLAAGAQGFFVNTFSSEMYSINESERLELARRAVKYVRGRAPVYATGSFGLTLSDKAEFARKIFDTGISAVVLVSSHYANVDDPDEQLAKNFELMFRLTGSIPFGIYEGPVPYKRAVSPEVFRRLLASGRVVHIVDGSNKLETIAEKANIAQGTSVDVFESYTPNAAAALEAGAAGLTVIAGEFFPEIADWLCRYAADKSRQTDVQWLQQELARVYPELLDAYPLNVKYFLRKRGLGINTISRAHSFELTPGQKRSMENIFSTFISWCEKLGVEPVHVDELRIPSYPLDPAI